MSGERIGSVSGWDAPWREPSLSQPGGRDHAPGDLVCVQAFINSHYDLEVDHGADLFATPPALAGWLTRRGIAGGAHVTEADVHRAVAVREGLRALARSNGMAEPSQTELLQPDRDASALAGLNEAAAGIPVEVRFRADGPRLVPGPADALHRALGSVLAITARAMIDGTWVRLKVCPGEQCGWAFYDHSRNQSGRWCSMSVCGGRSKARAHYRRRRGAD